MATTAELRAEAEMVRAEAGGELTTRAAMLMGAADEIDRMRSALSFIADREGLMFAECGDAEAIMRVVRDALGPRRKIVMVCGVDCHPGDSVCNNYCNMAPQKGPMQNAPPEGPDAMKGF